MHQCPQQQQLVARYVFEQELRAVNMGRVSASRHAQNRALWRTIMEMKTSSTSPRWWWWCLSVAATKSVM